MPIYRCSERHCIVRELTFAPRAASVTLGSLQTLAAQYSSDDAAGVRLRIQAVENLAAEPIPRFNIVRICDPVTVQLQFSDRDDLFRNLARNGLVYATSCPIMKG